MVGGLFSSPLPDREALRWIAEKVIEPQPTVKAAYPPIRTGVLPDGVFSRVLPDPPAPRVEAPQLVPRIPRHPHSARPRRKLIEAPPIQQPPWIPVKCSSYWYPPLQHIHKESPKSKSGSSRQTAKTTSTTDLETQETVQQGSRDMYERYVEQVSADFDTARKLMLKRGRVASAARHRQSSPYSQKCDSCGYRLVYM